MPAEGGAAVEWKLIVGDWGLEGGGSEVEEIGRRSAFVLGDVFVFSVVLLDALVLFGKSEFVPLRALVRLF